jgi:hypothetical protein
LLQADWGSTFGPAQVHQSVTFIMHIISIIGNLRYWGKSAIAATSVLLGSAASQMRFVGRLLGGFRSSPGRYRGAVEAEHVSQICRLFRGGAGGT